MVVLAFHWQRGWGVKRLALIYVVFCLFDAMRLLSWFLLFMFVRFVCSSVLYAVWQAASQKILATMSSPSGFCCMSRSGNKDQDQRFPRFSKRVYVLKQYIMIAKRQEYVYFLSRTLAAKNHHPRFIADDRNGTSHPGQTRILPTARVASASCAQEV